MFLRIILMLAMVGALGAVGFVLLGNNPKTSTAEAAPVPITGRSVLVAARNLSPARCSARPMCAGKNGRCRTSLTDI